MLLSLIMLPTIHFTCIFPHTLVHSNLKNEETNQSKLSNRMADDSKNLRTHFFFKDPGKSPAARKNIIFRYDRLNCL